MGIEFRASEPIAAWTEMTVALQRPGETKKVNCTGVIVACNGDPQSGYLMSMLFTNLSPQTQARLRLLT